MLQAIDVEMVAVYADEPVKLKTLSVRYVGLDVEFEPCARFTDEPVGPAPLLLE